MQIRYLSLCPAVASENTTTVKNTKHNSSFEVSNYISVFHLMLSACGKISAWTRKPTRLKHEHFMEGGNCFVRHFTALIVNVRSYLTDFFDLWSCWLHYKNITIKILICTDKTKWNTRMIIIKMFQLHEKDQLYTNVYSFHFLLHESICSAAKNLYRTRE